MANAYLETLALEKGKLAQNLTNQGVTASDTESMASLVSKVLDINVITCSVTVNTDAGATVYATRADGTQYTATANSNGVATVVIKKGGLYTFRAKVDTPSYITSGEVWSRIVSNVNIDSNSYSDTISLSFVKLTINTDSGVAVTVKNDSTSIISYTTTSTSDTLYVPCESGSATKDGAPMTPLSASGTSGSMTVNAPDVDIVDGTDSYSVSITFVSSTLENNTWAN